MKLSRGESLAGALRDDELGRFAREGFVAREQFLSQREVLTLRDLYDRVLAARSWSRGTVSAGLVWVHRPEDGSRELQEQACLARAAGIGADLFGVAARDIRVSWRFFYKPARRGFATPWHQDKAFVPASAVRGLTVWIPLDDVTVESGCLWYLPGSHLRGLFPHRQDPRDPTGMTLIAEGFGTAGAMPVPLPAGGCTIHHESVLHCAGPNVSDRPRRAAVLKCEITGHE